MKPSLDTLDQWFSFIRAMGTMVALALLLILQYENQKAPRFPEEPRAAVPCPPPCTGAAATQSQATVYPSGPLLP